MLEREVGATGFYSLIELVIEARLLRKRLLCKSPLEALPLDTCRNQLDEPLVFHLQRLLLISRGAPPTYKLVLFGESTLENHSKEKLWLHEQGTKNAIWVAIFVAAIMLGVASESADYNVFLAVPPLIIVLSLFVRVFKSRLAAVTTLIVGLALLVLSFIGEHIGLHATYNWHLSVLVIVFGSGLTYTTFALSRKKERANKKENSFMRIIAIILNALLFIMGLLYLIDASDTGERVIGGVVLFIAIFSAITLYLTKSESWMGLYLRRKAMEEKQKLNKMKGE